jgi:uncharacterized membrane protein YqjE
VALATDRSDTGRAEPSLGELFTELTQGMKVLVQQEVRLAKIEMSEKATALAKDLVLIAIGGSLLYAGFLALLGGVIAGLATVAELPVWGAALIVAALCLIFGAILMGAGASAMKRQSLKPEQTIQTLKEDAQWAKQQVS